MPLWVQCFACLLACACLPQRPVARPPTGTLHYTQLYGPYTLALTNCTRHKRRWPIRQPIQPSTNLLWDYLNLNVLQK